MVAHFQSGLFDSLSNVTFDKVRGPATAGGLELRSYASGHAAPRRPGQTVSAHAMSQGCSRSLQHRLCCLP